MMKTARLLTVLSLFAVSLFAQPLTQPDQRQSSPQSQKQFIAANGLLRLEMFSQARREFEKFLAAFPDSPQSLQARYGLGICLYRLGEYKQACAEIEKVLEYKEFAYRDQALAVLGSGYLADGQYQAAIKSIDTYLDSIPVHRHDENMLLNRAQAIYMLGEYQNALAAFEDFARRFPSSKRLDDAYYFCGLCANSLNKPDDCLGYLRHLVRTCPQTQHLPDALLLIGQIYQEKAQYDQAAINFRAMLDTAPAERKDEAYYSLGSVLYQAGNYPQAVTFFNQLIERYPQSRYCKPAMLQLAHSQYSSGMYNDALESFQKVIDTGESGGQVAIYYKAKTLGELGEYSKAFEIYKQLLDSAEKPERPDVLAFDAACCLIQLKRYEEAVRYFNKAAEDSSDAKLKARSFYRIAWCLNRLKKYDDSSQACEKVLSMQVPEFDKSAKMLLAENMFNLGEYQKADEAYTPLTADMADNPRLMLRWAQCAYLRDDYRQVIERIGKWSDDDPSSEDAQLQQGLFMLGHCQLKVKDYQSAEKTLKRFVMKSRDVNPQAMYYLAQAQRGAGMQQQADTTLAKLLEIDTKFENIWAIRAAYDFGRQEYLKGSELKARWALEKVLSAQGDVPPDMSAGACYMLAWIEYNSGDYLRAAENFARIRTDWPDYAMAEASLYYQAMAAQKFEKHLQAIELLGEYQDKYPTGKFYGDAAILKGFCLDKLGKKELATKELAAIENDENVVTPSVLYKLAWLRKENGDRAGATKSYQALLKKFPADKLADTVRVELAELLFDDKDYKEAAALLEKVVADMSAAPDIKQQAQYRLALACLNGGEPEQAAGIFEKFAESYPDSQYSPTGLYQAGGAWEKIGRLDNALRCYETVVVKYPQSPVGEVSALRFSQALGAAGKFDGAIKAFQKFLKAYPQSEYGYLAYYGMAQGYEKLDNSDKAIGYYKKVTDNFSGSTAASAQLQIGRILFARKDYSQAAVELVKVDIVYDDPAKGAAALFEAAEAFTQAGEIGVAKELYARCVEKYKGSEPAKQSAAALEEIDTLYKSEQ